MSSKRDLNLGVSVGFLLLLLASFLPTPVHAAFNVGAALRSITPAAAAACGNQGGASMAVVQGSRLAGVDSIAYPVLLAITCLDSSDVNKRSTVYFITPSDVGTVPAGTVIKTIQTQIAGVVAAPGNGWVHLVNRPDKGDLLGCGNNGTIYSIDYSQFTATADGTATLLPRPNVNTSCGGLAWDPEEDMIYQGLTSGSGTIDIARFKADIASPVATTFNTPCRPSALAITGGVLVVACDGASTILRLSKVTGANLGVNGTLGALGFPSGTTLNPALGDFACDPSTFAGQFKDAMWSRNGVNGNGVVALEFPAFTCGLPSNATVLSAGLSAPGPLGPGQLPLAGCFDASGNVKDTDGDGIPDCWETNQGGNGTGTGGGIDFNGDGIVDLKLCVQVNTNGDGVTLTTECADPNHKDIFVEMDWMQDHKPDPQALSQTQSVATVGVKSVRESFAAAPVTNPDATAGIRTHFQVDEQATFMTLTNTGPTSHVSEVAFTPCTGPASNAISQSDAADFDAIKKLNFGTAAERNNADSNAENRLNAKRLVFRYVLFAHKQIGASPASGSGSSGCAEVGGDDAIITLGGFTTTSVGGVSHARGTTDQQAGTFMHEFGHTLGLRHGGGDGLNCKPNYLSVMSYSRQFAGSPIPNRRLDYSRADLPDLNENGGLNENLGLGGNVSLGPLLPYFSTADQTAFGPSAWSVATATTVPLNWNRSKQGTSPSYQTNASANLNSGTGGCDSLDLEVLTGYNDWSNLLYRFSAALDFAGGIRTDTPQEITKKQEEELFLAGDIDANGVPDGQDCGGTIPQPPDGTTTFLCTHRIDIKPSFPVPKVLSLGKEANITIAIFSESSGALKWDASALVQTDTSLTFRVGSLVIPVKVNSKGGGTCSTSDVADPVTGATDGIKDLKCQFPTSGIPLGTHEGVVSGFFPYTVVDPTTNQPVTVPRAFRARQTFTVVP